MQINCPNVKCESHVFPSPKTNLIVSNGSFYRRSDSRRIRRYYCKACQSYFSKATLHPCFKQKKRRINSKLNALISSGVSQRRAALLLHVNRKTIVRHFRFLATQARIKHIAWLKRYEDHPLQNIQFDDLETSEHSKSKPLSVALAVDPKYRKILNFQVARMPAKGLLAKKALIKYGYRPDERDQAWDQMMRELLHAVSPRATWLSDQNPHYQKHLLKYYPHAIHFQTKGGRGCITGQGELKKLHFDPLFSLNHTCAMLRANLNRLFRRTWCTTKNIQGLKDHLALFVVYFNQTLTPDGLESAGLGASY